jgi:hypothetical protein
MGSWPAASRLSLDELIDELGGQHVFHPVLVHRRLGAHRDEQMRPSGATVADQRQRQAEPKTRVGYHPRVQPPASVFGSLPFCAR